MNTRPAIDETNGPVSLAVAFNQDNSCFSVGHDNGFCVFNANPCELTVSRELNAGIGIAEMLGRANVMALVGGGTLPAFPQNKVIIWDDAKRKPVTKLEFRTPVTRVRLSRERIIVVLNNSVHMYTLSSTKKLADFQTADNALGLCCLGSKIVAFPGRTPGQVQLVELGTLNVSIIPAHTAPLKAMAMSPDGEVLATASEKGTLVRIFSTANCAKMGELRRGVEAALIYSIAISPSSKLLAVTSDKSTLHIFDLPQSYGRSPRDESPAGRSLRSINGGLSPDSAEEGGSNKWGLLGKIPLLPRVFSDTYSFASAHFETDDNPRTGLGSAQVVPIPGIAGGRPRKGILGWVNDDTIIVIGAGRDGRWEKFILGEGDDSKRRCIRQGWRRFLGS